MSILPKTPDDEFKSFVYDQFSRIGKALSSPARLIMMNILCQGEHTVESLSRYACLTVANVSRHLQVLKFSNFVKMRREKKHIYYSVPDERTLKFFEDFKSFAHHQLAEIRMVLREIAESPSRLNSVSREELIKKIQEEDAIVIDVRPGEEYRQGHLPGAISIPLEELEKRIKKLPRDKMTVAYCRGRFCILADQAVNILNARGVNARRTDDSVVEWKITGLSIEEEPSE